MNKLTEIAFVIDRSGSMTGQETDIIGGFNSMVEKQKRAGYSALVTTVLFNDRLQMLHDRISLEQVKPMTDADYSVGGSTALLDAMGETISHIRRIHKYARPEDRPEKTLCVIMTDGAENSSRHFHAEQIKQMVQEQEKVGWEFLFIGADIDAFAASEDVGISKRHAVQFRKNKDSLAGCMDAVGDVVSCVAQSKEKLQDDDWDILRRIFNTKKRQ